MMRRDSIEQPTVNAGSRRHNPMGDHVHGLPHAAPAQELLAVVVVDDTASAGAEVSGIDAVVKLVEGGEAANASAAQGLEERAVLANEEEERLVELNVHHVEALGLDGP